MILDVGIHTIPAAAYHADPCPVPSLSSSIAKQLCLASPLHARQAHPRLTTEPTAEACEAMDVGTAAHMWLLEQLSQIAVIDAKDFRTKAAQEARDAARAAGQVPLLAARWHHVENMVAAARGQLAAHRDGGAAMFTNGLPEQTLIWREGPTWCRARLDWLRPGAIDDYKTTTHGTANPDAWSRSLFAAGHDIQAAFYLRGLKALTGDDATFRFAVQESFEPYALAVIGLGPDALMLAEKKVLYALELWQRGLERDDWPGYPPRTCWATLPAWQEAAWLEKEMR